MEKEENNNKLNSLTIHSSPLKARYWIENYSRENGGWKSYTNTSWATMLFDNFTGDERLKGALHPKNWTVE